MKERDYKDQIIYVVETEEGTLFYPVIPEDNEENRALALNAAKENNEGAQIYTLDADCINKTPLEEKTD